MSRVSVYNENKASARGVGFTGLLQIAFIVLKLCGAINWSWLWVLSPIWLSTLLLCIIFAVVLLFIRS